MAAHQAPPSLGFSRQEHWSGLSFLLQCVKVKSESEVAQSCPTLSDLMDCSLPGSSVHGIFQARVLEWVAIAFSTGSSTFSKSNLYIWKFLVHVLLKPSLKDFEHYLASMWNEYTMQQFEHSLALPFFGIGIKTDLFQSCGHCWVFQIFLHMSATVHGSRTVQAWLGEFWALFC